MSNFIINAKETVDAIHQLINSASMQRRNIHYSHLLSVCESDSDVRYAMRLAKNSGVRVVGRPYFNKRSFQSPTDVHLHPCRERGEVKACFAIFMFLAVIAAAVCLIDGSALTLLTSSIEKMLEAMMM